MSHSERHRQRVLRLKGHIKTLEARGKPEEKIALFKTELSRLITGNKQSRPAGATVGAKVMKLGVQQVRRKK